jgi:hypothetical protein
METPTPGQRTKSEPAPDVAQLRQRAEAGDRKAQYDLAEHLRAQWRHKAKREASGWYQKAGEQGYALATHMHGVMYWGGEFGYTNPATIRVALSLFEEAAGQGLSWSALAVANAHAKGARFWMKKDLLLACQWTLIAEGVAARGEWEAEFPITVNAARRELPDRLIRARKSLSSTQVTACEEQAAEWLRAHPPLK